MKGSPGSHQSLTVSDFDLKDSCLFPFFSLKKVNSFNGTPDVPGRLIGSSDSEDASDHTRVSHDDPDGHVRKRGKKENKTSEPVPSSNKGPPSARPDSRTGGLESPGPGIRPGPK